jgi:acyl-CoA thioester hydrolase
VKNIDYLRYVENTRIFYSEKLGLHRMKDETGTGPVLVSTNCKYRLPLTYPDTVSVGAKITNIEENRFWMKYRVVSHHHRRIAAKVTARPYCTIIARAGTLQSRMI